MTGPWCDARVQVLDPQGVVRFETDDISVAFAKAAHLAAPTLSGGTPRWYEAGWRVSAESANSQECVCAETSIRHCPVHGQGDADSQSVPRP